MASLLDPTGAFLHLITSALTHFIDGARGDLTSSLQKYLFTTVDSALPGMQPFTQDPAISRMNFGMAIAADVILAAVTTYIFLRSVVDSSTNARYQLRASIPRLLMGIIFIHFSLPFIQMAIDLNNALGSAALSLGSTLHVDGLPWSPTISAPAVAQMSASQDIFHALFAVVAVVAVVILVLSYVVRYALLAVLTVTAPLAALCSILPETHRYLRSWMRLLFVTIFMQAVQLIVLRVAASLTFDNGGGLVQTLYGLGTLFLIMKVPGALHTAAHLETKSNSLLHHAETRVKHVFHHAHTVRRAA